MRVYHQRSGRLCDRKHDFMVNTNSKTCANEFLDQFICRKEKRDCERTMFLRSYQYIPIYLSSRRIIRVMMGSCSGNGEITDPYCFFTKNYLLKAKKHFIKSISTSMVCLMDFCNNFLH